MADSTPTQEEGTAPPEAAAGTETAEAGAEDNAPASEEVKLVVKNLSYGTFVWITVFVIGYIV